MPVIPAPLIGRQMDPWSSLTPQSNLLSELQAKEQSCLKTQLFFMSKV